MTTTSSPGTERVVARRQLQISSLTETFQSVPPIMYSVLRLLVCVEAVAVWATEPAVTAEE